MGDEVTGWDGSLVVCSDIKLVRVEVSKEVGGNVGAEVVSLKYETVERDGRES